MPYVDGNETGSLHERRPMRLIRPTLSACCDESQLLLGIPSLSGGSPIEVHPRHNCCSCVRRYSYAGCIDPLRAISLTARDFCIGYPPIGFLNYCIKQDINICLSFSDFLLFYKRFFNHSGIIRNTAHLDQ
jgi:hypothetical protein